MHVGLAVAVEVASDRMQRPARARIGFLGIGLPDRLAGFEHDGALVGGVPLVCTTTASNSLKLLVLVASRLCASSHAFVSWAADGNAVASAATMIAP